MIVEGRASAIVLAAMLIAACTPGEKSGPPKQSAEDTAEANSNIPPARDEAAAASGAPQLSETEIERLHRSAQNGDNEAKWVLVTFANQWVPECARNENLDCNKLRPSGSAEKIRKYQAYLIDLLRVRGEESTCFLVDSLVSSDLPVRLDGMLRQKRRFAIDQCTNENDIHRTDRRKLERFFELSEQHTAD